MPGAPAARLVGGAAGPGQKKKTRVQRLQPLTDSGQPPSAEPALQVMGALFQ